MTSFITYNRVGTVKAVYLRGRSVMAGRVMTGNCDGYVSDIHTISSAVSITRARAHTSPRSARQPSRVYSPAGLIVLLSHPF